MTHHTQKAGPRSTGGRPSRAHDPHNVREESTVSDQDDTTVRDTTDTAANSGDVREKEHTR